MITQKLRIKPKPIYYFLTEHGYDDEFFKNQVRTVPFTKISE